MKVIVFGATDARRSSTRPANAIAGDTDLDGDGALVALEKTDEVVETLKVLKHVGVITGREMGQIIKQTKRPRE